MSWAGADLSFSPCCTAAPGLVFLGGTTSHPTSRPRGPGFGSVTEVGPLPRLAAGASRTCRPQPGQSRLVHSSPRGFVSSAPRDGGRIRASSSLAVVGSLASIRDSACYSPEPPARYSSHPVLVVSSQGPRCDRIPFLLLRDSESIASRRRIQLALSRPAQVRPEALFRPFPRAPWAWGRLMSCVLLAWVGDLAPIR